MRYKETPVIEFLRVSTQEQDVADRAGIPRQIEANRRTVERHGLTVIRTVKLVDVSGASVMYAPEMAEMLVDLRSGLARGIVCADFDRLMRPDDFRSLSVLQDIREADALIYLPDQVIDLNTQSGYLMSGLQSVIAGNELTQIKKRMLGGKEAKRRQGKNPNNANNLPLGVSYDRETEKYFYNDDIEKVRELFELFHVKRIHNLVEIQRQTGIKHQTVRRLLSNELFIGYRHYTMKRSDERRTNADGRRKDKRKVKRSEAECIRVKVIDNPLIDEAVFWEIQEILKNKRARFTDRRKAGKSLFLFAGMVRCGVCGEYMYTTPGGKKGPSAEYYYCRSRSPHFRRKGVEICGLPHLRRDKVESTLLRFITEELSYPDYIVEAFRRLRQNENKAAMDREIEVVQKNITTLKGKKKKLLDLLLQDVFTEDEIKTKANALQGEIDRLGIRLVDLSKPRPAIDPEQFRYVVEMLVEACSEFPFWTDREKREFLDLYKPQFYLIKDGVSKFRLFTNDLVCNDPVYAYTT